MDSATLTKVALVSGANRGLGHETARQLGRLGYAVAIGVRDPRKGEEAARALKEDGISVIAVVLDVADASTIKPAIETTVHTFGRLDVLVNNAGINYDTWHTAASADLANVRETFDTNFFGAWALAQAAIPFLKKTRGRIVNVSSGAGAMHDMGIGTPGYSTSKAALNALTRILADELRTNGILVNSVCPGWVATDMGGGGRPIPEGAAGIVWAATLPDDGLTSGFFRDGKAIQW
jgi:NAD(P)-dependent dehydrogenase (short-subunit alcohol dehydrogenase family)